MTDEERVIEILVNHLPVGDPTDILHSINFAMGWSTENSSLVVGKLERARRVQLKTDSTQAGGATTIRWWYIRGRSQ